MKKISVDSIVKRLDSNLIISEVDNEIIMMDLENGSYISLNYTGKAIWERIKDPIRVKDLIENLMNNFNIDEEACTFDTINFLTKISKQKALDIIQE